MERERRCHSPSEISRLPRSLLVIAGSRNWWPTREKRLARELRRAGHEVVLAEVKSCCASELTQVGGEVGHKSYGERVLVFGQALESAFEVSLIRPVATVLQAGEQPLHPLVLAG